MATIQIEVSPELAERLQRYEREIPRMLEKALRELEYDAGDQSSPEAVHDAATARQREEVLRESGAIGPSTEAAHRHLRERVGQEWAPLTSAGQPASEMIIEERKSRSWGEALAVREL